MCLRRVANRVAVRVLFSFRQSSGGQSRQEEAAGPQSYAPHKRPCTRATLVLISSAALKSRFAFVTAGASEITITNQQGGAAAGFSSLHSLDDTSAPHATRSKQEPDLLANVRPPTQEPATPTRRPGPTESQQNDSTFSPTFILFDSVSTQTMSLTNRQQPMATSAAAAPGLLQQVGMAGSAAVITVSFIHPIDVVKVSSRARRSIVTHTQTRRWR